MTIFTIRGRRSPTSHTLHRHGAAGVARARIEHDLAVAHTGGQRGGNGGGGALVVALNVVAARAFAQIPNQHEIAAALFALIVLQAHLVGRWAVEQGNAGESGRDFAVARAPARRRFRLLAYG